MAEPAQQSASSLKSQNSDLSGRLDSAQAEITNLSNQPQATFASVSATPADAGAQLRAGNFTLANSYCVDLDETASPDWSYSNSCDSGPSDLEQNGPVSTDGKNSADLVLLAAGQTPTYTFCVGETEYSDSVFIRDFKVGDEFCVRASSGNLAGLQVQSIGQNQQTVGFSAIVWAN